MRLGLACRGICLALVFLLAGLSLVVTPEPSYACSCASVSPSEALEHSYAVFMGTVTSIRYHESGAGRGYVGETAKFDVEMVWKGPVSQTIYVTPSSYNSSCGLGFTQGSRYLVYADRDGVHACTRTRPAERAGEDLAILGEGQIPKTGTASPPSHGTSERPLTKTWADPTPLALELQTRGRADPTPLALELQTRGRADPTPLALELQTRGRADPTPPALELQTRGRADSAPTALVQQTGGQVDPPPPSEQTGTGCSRSTDATDVSAIGVLGGIAWLGLMRRRAGDR